MSDFSARTAVIVDGHPLWLDALETLLERMELQVVGKATRAADAARLIAEHHPDLVVTDIAAGACGTEPGGSSVIAQARKQNQDVRCVVLSEADDPREREQAFADGANVFCVKRTEPDDLATAIRQSFDNSIHFAEPKRTWPAPAAVPTSANGMISASLTKREVEILRLVAEGHSNSQLARMLWVTEQTVKFHLSNIYRKLNVANRTEASRWAQVNGMLEYRDAEPAVA